MNPGLQSWVGPQAPVAHAIVRQRRLPIFYKTLAALHSILTQRMKAELSINGESHAVEAEGDTPLLWVLRDYLGLTGTKFGCGIGQCGACTVHIDGNATRSCLLPLESAAGAKITTIEGLSRTSDHPLQRAWLEFNVAQCGYCQAGMLMAAAALLREHPKPSDEQIDAAMTNICRCGTYTRIRSAIHRAAAG
jgi:isoquinoline 1-oxidoreductase subunit alpha